MSRKAGRARLAVNGKVVAVLASADTPKSDAAEAVAALYRRWRADGQSEAVA